MQAEEFSEEAARRQPREAEEQPEALKKPCGGPLPGIGSMMPPLMKVHSASAASSRTSAGGG